MTLLPFSFFFFSLFAAKRRNLENGFLAVAQVVRESMRREVETGLSGDVPIVLSQWYDTTKWILEKIDKFPKNQRFVFGTRLADRSLGILEGLVQASYSRGSEKVALLETANRDLAVLRWLIRMAKDRQVISVKQYEYGCGRMYECGKMLGGWIKDARKRAGG